MAGLGTKTTIPRTRGLALLVSLALAAVAAAPAAPATAAPQGSTFALSVDGIGGAPLLRGAPGRVLHGAVQVRNLTKNPISVRLQPADIRNATNGNADYATTDLSGAGRWLSLATRTVRLPAGATQRVEYSVSIPPSATGASHYAGVVAVDAADLAPDASTAKGEEQAFTIDRINRQALPITVRLPGPLTHSLALDSVKLDVSPAGAGLILGLAPQGTELTPEARVDLRVERDSRVVFTHDTTLGQLFPGDSLDYLIPWEGRPTEGEYRVVGVIRPEGAPEVVIDHTVTFTSDTQKEIEEETTPGPAPPGLPLWVWVALAAAGTALVALLFAVWRLKRRTVAQIA